MQLWKPVEQIESQLLRLFEWGVPSLIPELIVSEKTLMALSELARSELDEIVNVLISAQEAVAVVVRTAKERGTSALAAVEIPASSFPVWLRTSDWQQRF